MKITLSPHINFSNRNYASNPYKRSTFTGAREIFGDVFERPLPKKVKEVKVQMLNGEPKEAVITREDVPEECVMCPKGSMPVKYKMNLCTNQGVNYYGLAYSLKKDDTLRLEHLFTDEDYMRKYKGAGTEILKCMVNESKNRGYNGKINVHASNFPPPFVFYYKNNFKAVGDYSNCNAAIDYAARHNIPVTRVMNKHQSALPMELDAMGAEDLLKGKREYKDRDFAVIDKRKVGENVLETNLIEAPDGLLEEFYIQIIDDSKEELKERYVACARRGADKEGQPCLIVFNINDSNADCETEQYAEEMSHKAASRFGLEKVVMCTKRRR